MKKCLDCLNQPLSHGLFYHLHGQTGRFTDWANGNQNSRLVNFVPESRLPFARISFIDQNTVRQRW